MYLQPFDKHPANVAALRQCASELLKLSAEAINNGEATRQAYQPAIANWDGMCSPEMAAAAKPVQQGSKQAQHMQAWAAAAAQYWGTQVEGFNAQVDAITAGLAGQAGKDYGATGTGGEPPTNAQIAEARAGVTAAARQQWMQAHAVWIEDGRMRVQAMLRDGPTEAHLLELREAGVLPGHGFNPLPDIWGAAENLVLPAAYLGSLGFGALGANLGLLGLGGFTTWANYVKYGAFKPMGYRPSGRYGYIAPRSAPFYMRLQNKHWQAKAYKSGIRKKWLNIGRIGTRASGALAIGSSFYDQWSRDSGRTDLNTSEKVGRATARATFSGGGAVAGAWAGAKVGVAVTAFVPVPGARVVGGLVGGAIGGIVGSGVGEEIADHTVKWAGDRAEDIADAAKDVGSALNPFD